MYRIVKFGGACLTNKKTGEFESLNKEKLEMLVQHSKLLWEDCRKSGDHLIIVIGAGCFGHSIAKEFHLNDRQPNQIEPFDRIAFSKCRESVRKLLAIVVSSLLSKDIPGLNFFWNFFFF